MFSLPAWSHANLTVSQPSHSTGEMRIQQIKKTRRLVGSPCLNTVVHSSVLDRLRGMKIVRLLLPDLFDQTEGVLQLLLGLIEALLGYP